MIEVLPKVTLDNQDEVVNIFYKLGYFARECYDSSGGFEAIGKHVLNVNHGSALRSVIFKFDIHGISRACSHQLVRHKIGVDVNQRSQRYVDEDGFNFIIPPSIKARSGALDRFLSIMTTISRAYSDLRNIDNIPPEDARFVLPNACETRMTMVFSLQALMHFMHERLCSRAQWEIRRIANLVKLVTVEPLPELKPYLDRKCVGLGYCPEGNGSCGAYPKKQEILGISEVYRELAGQTSIRAYKLIKHFDNRYEEVYYLVHNIEMVADAARGIMLTNTTIDRPRHVSIWKMLNGDWVLASDFGTNDEGIC